jgi:hypothetical protein
MFLCGHRPRDFWRNRRVFSPLRRNGRPKLKNFIPRWRHNLFNFNISVVTQWQTAPRAVTSAGKLMKTNTHTYSRLIWKLITIWFKVTHSPVRFVYNRLNLISSPVCGHVAILRTPRLLLRVAIGKIALLSFSNHFQYPTLFLDASSRRSRWRGVGEAYVQQWTVVGWWWWWWWPFSYLRLDSTKTETRLQAGGRSQKYCRIFIITWWKTCCTDPT